MSNAAPARKESLLERLALQRPELRAFALYDWANSAFVTVVVTAIYPLYFVGTVVPEEAGDRAARWHALTTAAALFVIAVVAPVLGAFADRARAKKRLLAVFLALGVLSTAGLATIGPGDVARAIVLFFLANVAASGSFVFYDALLPHVARGARELDRLSTSAYALGYLGGGTVLAVCLVLISGSADRAQAAVRTSFLLVAVWWAAFSVPLFRRIAEPPATSIGAALGGFADFRRTLRDLFRLRQAFWMLLAFLVYNDGINTIIRMATVLGEEMGLARGSMIGAVLAVQFLGIPCTFLFGALAGKIGAKRAVLLGLSVYLAICVLGANLRTETHFWLLAGGVALVQGGTQALSRSLFAGFVPASRSAEFFGVFAVLDRFGAVLGPTLFAAASHALGGSRPAVLALVPLFVLGALLLTRVDVAGGRAAALAAESASSRP